MIWALCILTAISSFGIAPRTSLFRAERISRPSKSRAAFTPIRRFWPALWLRGLVASVDGRRVLEADGRDAQGDVEGLGRGVAESLIARGAEEILREVYDAP